MLTLSLATDGFAQNRPIDLVSASLEDLMRIEITSAGRREQSAEDVPAAIFVLTSDDIRRSGIQSLPELFRLVPGMQVGRINGNKWAVSARGFNDLFADKLLVLIDGRTIYKRTFSGVFWHAEDLMLEDIERIEVIRGAGGTIWGANAVNGVINIITKPAADTQGTLVRVGAGTATAADGAVRYGGHLGGLDYRVFGLWQDSRAGRFEDGTRAHDDWNTARRASGRTGPDGRNR
jgi:iron complex outermembrane receptor protein